MPGPPGGFPRGTATRSDAVGGTHGRPMELWKSLNFQGKLAGAKSVPNAVPFCHLLELFPNIWPLFQTFVIATNSKLLFFFCCCCCCRCFFFFFHLSLSKLYVSDFEQSGERRGRCRTLLGFWMPSTTPWQQKCMLSTSALGARIIWTSPLSTRCALYYSHSLCPKLRDRTADFSCQS